MVPLKILFLRPLDDRENTTPSRQVTLEPSKGQTSDFFVEDLKVKGTHRGKAVHADMIRHSRIV